MNILIIIIIIVSTIILNLLNIRLFNLCSNYDTLLDVKHNYGYVDFINEDGYFNNNSSDAIFIRVVNYIPFANAVIFSITIIVYMYYLISFLIFKYKNTLHITINGKKLDMTSLKRFIHPKMKK